MSNEHEIEGVPDKFWDGCKQLDMSWGTNVYRWRGVGGNGFPRLVEAWCSATETWEPCPNINVARRIAGLMAARKT